jgi:hypothetical protein
MAELGWRAPDFAAQTVTLNAETCRPTIWSGPLVVEPVEAGARLDPAEPGLASRMPCASRPWAMPI